MQKKKVKEKEMNLCFNQSFNIFDLREIKEMC